MIQVLVSEQFAFESFLGAALPWMHSEAHGSEIIGKQH